MSEEKDFQQFFGKHADSYAHSSSHASGSDLQEFLRMMAPKSTDVCLDMATGTGFTAAEFATKCEKVIALDGTEQMLDKAKKLAEEKNLKNMEFVVSTVEKTPLKDNSVDLVTCRRAAHHFHDKREFLSECRRVLKTGGKLGIVDMIRNEDDFHDIRNKMEIARDSSHFYAPKISEWRKMVEENGFTIITLEEMEEPYTYAKWLSPIVEGGDEDAKAKDIILSEGKDDLLRAGFDRDKMTFSKKRMILVASRI